MTTASLKCHSYKDYTHYHMSWYLDKKDWQNNNINHIKTIMVG